VSQFSMDYEPKPDPEPKKLSIGERLIRGLMHIVIGVALLLTSAIVLGALWKLLYVIVFK